MLATTQSQTDNEKEKAVKSQTVSMITHQKTKYKEYIKVGRYPKE